MADFIGSAEPNGVTTASRSTVGEMQELVEKPSLKKTLTFWLCLSSFIAGLSSFQFGYNIGVVNTPQAVVQEWLNASYKSLYDDEISNRQLNLVWSVITSIFGIGGLIGAFSAGFIADKVGRKNGILLNGLLSLVGALLMGCASQTDWFYILMIGRFIIGINCAMHTALAPLYLTEISPTVIRGAMGTLNQLFITIGILIGGIMGLKSVLGTYKLWSAAFGTVRIRDFVRHRYLWLPLIIAIVMMFSQQFSGINAVSAKQIILTPYGMHLTTLEGNISVNTAVFPAMRFMHDPQALFYSTNILKDSAQLPEDQAAYATIGMQCVLVAMTFVSIPLMERLGRRSLHLAGLGGCCISLVLLFVSLLILTKGYKDAGFAAVAFIITFVVFFAIGPGSIPWFFVFELFQQNSRGIATSIAVGFNWLGLFVSGLAFLPLKDAMNEYVFLVFTSLLVFFFLFTWKFVPETKNREIDDIVNGFK